MLHWHVEQRLEPLLHELADLGWEEVPRDRQAAVDREPSEPDRRAAQAVGVA